MAQTYTSSATSINSKKLPAVYRKATLSRSTPFVVDYGCGKHTDHIQTHLSTMHKTLYPYDPYNQPDVVNKHTMGFVEWAISKHCEIDVVCSNVLNVIDDDDTVLFIATQVSDFARYTGGTAYVTVYEGDRSGIGRRTGVDQYQRNAPLRDYLRFFGENATIKNGMIIVKGA